MRVDVKVCGLTRPEDARDAARLGARYVGVVFAPGPRMVDAARARAVLDGAGEGVDRVGVFGNANAIEVAAAVREARLDIVQLHADPSVSDVCAAREASGAKVWAVMRVNGALRTTELHELWEAASALVLDSKVGGKLGGTGAPFDWEVARDTKLEHFRGGGRRRFRVPLVVAGGLTPDNVEQAIAALSPTIVDVSSGVESSPGIKDRARISDFISAVRRAESIR